MEFSKIAFVPVGLEASVNALSTDVAGYLQTEYEKQIIASVERVQKEVSCFSKAFFTFEDKQKG